MLCYWTVIAASEEEQTTARNKQGAKTQPNCTTVSSEHWRGQPYKKMNIVELAYLLYGIICTK